MSETTLPVKERLALAVAAAIEGVTLSGGYTVEVQRVIRPARRTPDIMFRDYDVILWQGDEDLAEDEYQAFPAFAIYLPFIVTLVAVASESETEPMDRKLNIFEAEVQRALKADSQFGGLCVDSFIEPGVQITAVDGAFEGREFVLRCIVRTKETDPYTPM